MTAGRSLRLGEALFGGGVLALGLFVAWQTASIHVAPTYAAIGPRAFPYLIAGGLLLIGALLLNEGLFGRVAHERGIALDGRAIGLVAGALVAQFLLIEQLGWILATTLQFAAAARAFRAPGIGAAARLDRGVLLLSLGVVMVSVLALGLSVLVDMLAEPSGLEGLLLGMGALARGLGLAMLALMVTDAITGGRARLDLLIGVALAALAYIVFNYGLELDLPTGSWVERLTGVDADG